MFSLLLNLKLKSYTYFLRIYVIKAAKKSFSILKNELVTSGKTPEGISTGFNMPTPPKERQETIKQTKLFLVP